MELCGKLTIIIYSQAMFNGLLLDNAAQIQVVTESCMRYVQLCLQHTCIILFCFGSEYMEDIFELRRKML